MILTWTSCLGIKDSRREHWFVVLSFSKCMEWTADLQNNDEQQLGQLRWEAYHNMNGLKDLSVSIMFKRAFDEEFQSDHKYLNAWEKEEAEMPEGQEAYYVRQRSWLSPKASSSGSVWFTGVINPCHSQYIHFKTDLADVALKRSLEIRNQELLM